MRYIRFQYGPEPVLIQQILIGFEATLEMIFPVKISIFQGTGLSVGDLNIVKRRSNFFQTMNNAPSKLYMYLLLPFTRSFLIQRTQKHHPLVGY